MDSYIQMKLYSLTKRQFLFLFLIFFAFFFVSIFIGWVGPSVINVVTVDKGRKAQNSQLVMISPEVSISQQQLWLQIEILLDRPKNDPMIEKVTYLTVPMLLRLYSFEDGVKTPINSNTRSHDRRLRCRSFDNKCTPVTVLHLGYIEYKKYYVEIETSEALLNGSTFKPIWTSYNAHFTELELWFRFIFLLLAFVTAVLLCRSLKKYSIQDWSIEQKWMIILLILVMLYNNPLFPLLLLVYSPLITVIDACFTVTFLCSLLMFWLCVYHGIRKAERHFFSFYFLKICLVGMLWSIGCIILSWSAINEQSDPTFSISQDQEGFLGIKIFFFVLLGIYVLYLLFLLIRAYSELHSMPYFDVRLKFLTTLTVIILLISLLAVIVRFGRAILEDSVVMEITLRWNNSAEFLCFYSLFNSYIYTLAFVYSPSKATMYESYKDNPASFAMLSDSEDEVLYRGKKFVYDDDEESM